MSYRLGIDIGGTFTDFVAYDEGGKDLQDGRTCRRPRIQSKGL